MSGTESPQWQETPEAFAHHLREAVETLRYFKTEAFSALVDLYRQRWEGGTSSTMLKKDEILPLLTEEGRADPRLAQIATYSRAMFNMYRQRDAGKESVWLKLGTNVRFSASVKMVCDEARAKDGTILPIGERWPLPLPECGQEWCPCSWRLVYASRSKAR